MAKQDLTKLSLDELEALKLPINDDQVKAKRALKLAEGRVTRNYNKLKAINLEIESRQEVTLEAMLETYIASGENSVGYKWLQDRTWKGEWKDSGIGYMGSYWQETNQRVLTIRLSEKDSDEKLEKLEKLIVGEIMPAIKAGAYEAERGDLKLLSKGSSIPLKDLKILDVSAADLCQYHNWQLGEMPNGEWVIFDSYTAKFSFGRARLVGTLRECLEEIRKYLNIDHKEDEES